MEKTELHITEYDPSTMPVDATVLIVGKRNTGKTTLTRDLLYHLRNKLFKPTQLIITESNKRFLEDYEWEYHDGYKLDAGDFIIFQNQKCLECNYYLRTDTIFHKSIPEAILVSIDAQDFKIVVSSVDGTRLGSYVFEDLDK